MNRRPHLAVPVPDAVVRVLTGTVLFRTRDKARVMESRWMYREASGGRWELSLLGALHTLTGATIWAPDDTDNTEEHP